MRVLIVGANYGLLLAGMMLERNIQVDVFGTENQVKVLNEEGFTINSNEKNWKFRPSNNWDGINSVQNKNYDLAVLAVQEPSLANQVLGNILSYLSKKSVPIFSIMNIPFFQFLTETIGIKNIDNLDHIYSSINHTKELKSNLIINSNPEPQVFSLEKFNELSVRLGGVFRCSSLNMLNYDLVKKLTMVVNEGLPVRIKQYESPWVSISKLPMLVTGNYRCFDSNQLRSIHEAIQSDIILSEVIYNQVVDILKKLGASRETIIPFRAYLKASIKLDAPSSVCRAIDKGKANVERVDRLVQSLGKSINFKSPEIDSIVNNIDYVISSKQ